MNDTPNLNGLAFCTWCGYSKSYVAGSAGQTAAAEEVIAHTQRCGANPVVQLLAESRARVAAQRRELRRLNQQIRWMRAGSTKESK